MRQGKTPETIEASIFLPDKYPPERIILFVRAPFDKPIKAVTVNGKEWREWDKERETVVVTGEREKVEVVVKY